MNKQLAVNNLTIEDSSTVLGKQAGSIRIEEASLSYVPSVLSIEDCEYKRAEIRSFRQRLFGNKYDKPFSPDDYVFDQNAIYLSTRPPSGKLQASCRIVLDSAFGLPCQKHDQDIIDGFRKQGCLIGEPGNLAITQKHLIPKYLVTMFEIAEQLGITDYLFTTKNRRFYQKVLSANTVTEDIGFDYGSEFTFSLMLWNINQSRRALSKYSETEL